MSEQLIFQQRDHFQPDCTNCFGLCCVALPYAESADFAFDKTGGMPCRNLSADYRCGIHRNLRINGFKGCTVYECFGAGQKVSQVLYGGKSWRDHPEIAGGMFAVFPIVQQLHEMLLYIQEAFYRTETRPIHEDLQEAFLKIQHLVNLPLEKLQYVYVPEQRLLVGPLLQRASELVRANVPQRRTALKGKRVGDLLGAKLRGARLQGVSLRGALLIAADLREADLRQADLLGADLRDADLRGADLTGSIFLTQTQVNAAQGDAFTKLPASLSAPAHWRQ